MASVDVRYDELWGEEPKTRRETYRVRRPHASRRRSRNKRTAQAPGGIHKRRNKHWNW